MPTEPPIPFHHFGGKGQVIHFAHANGFPPKGYQQFIQPFTKKYEVIACKFRPLWGNRAPAEVKHWQTLADDMIRFLDERGLSDVICMGHSMGGTISALVAHHRPDLVQQIVLIDPVIFPYYYYLFTRFFPNGLLKKWIPVAKVSAKRRYQWHSKEEVFQLWRDKKVFRRFSNEILQAFIDAAIVPADDKNVTLAYSREWETQIYLTVPYAFSKILQLKIPITVVRAENTNVIPPNLWSKWKEKQPATKFIDFGNAGHLVPLEYPTVLAQRILESLV